jgi:steroid delta-isomerase-like uncharacterized protein
MSKYLIVAHQTALSLELQSKVSTLTAEDSSAEFTVLVPELPGVPPTWEGETVDVARQRAEAAKAVLEEKVGARVFRTAVGTEDPLQAIADELREHPGYDTILISTLPPGVSRWLGRDLVHRTARKFGLPVIHVVAEAPALVPPRPDRLLEEWATAWSRHDVEKLLALCTDDCVYEEVAIGAVYRGKAEVRSFAKAVFTAFDDVKIQLRSGFTAGHWAGAEWRMTGTHVRDLPGIPATGKSFAVRGSTICELKAGKIRRNADYWDLATFLKQTGLRLNVETVSAKVVQTP